MEKIIIVNSGSTSKKYALYEGDKLVISFHFEIGNEGEYVLHQFKDGHFQQDVKITDEEYEKAFDYCVDLLLKNSYIKFETEIKAAVFRIVAPGTYFTFDRVIDEEFLEKLDSIREQAPLHIDKMHSEFNQVKDRLDGIKLIGISDSRFHKTMLDVASIYALPKKVVDELDIRRFGYHGISISSVVRKIREEKGEVPENMIICHLGGGSSITALKNGETIDTSMGYSPLEGLPMATRVGNVDSGALISIEDQMDLDMHEIRDMMYHQSGLKGISGSSDDVRELISFAEVGDEDARLALEYFAYHIIKYIGSYYAVLGGLDLLVFTGTIGERSAPVRKLILQGLGGLGIEMDPTANSQISGEGYLNRPGSDISVEILYTEENEEMARRALDLL